MAAWRPDSLDELQAELDETRRVRSGLRHNIRELRAAGKLTVAWERKLQSQVEACSRHIARFEDELQRANLEAAL